MPRAIGDQKKCLECGEVKHVSGYYKFSVYIDGLNPRCKPCSKIKARNMNIKHGRNKGGHVESMFTREQAEEIKRLYAEGHSQRGIGEMFGVYHTTIRKVIADGNKYYKGESPTAKLVSESG